ncbi:hypothetical protein I317_07091 [Kwoniella heveanensis CBS 569]|nr:hypothetical protein I317_07091 [Kwoniella heveanensis CBS 569]
MDHPSFSWYPTLTPTYDPIPLSSQNPKKNLGSLRKLISALISPEVGWSCENIHLFGWGQGGSMVLELALDTGKNAITTTATKEQGEETHLNSRFGSAVSICAGLLTHPTTDLNLNTPICYFTRLSPKSSVYSKQLTPIKRAFREVAVIQGSAAGAGEGMPRGRDEWFGIMKFWAQVLARKDEGWKGQGEVYEVVR